VFFFTSIVGDDRILDFESGIDTIDLRPFGISTANVSVTQSGADSIVSVDSNMDGSFDFFITVVGATPAPADLVF
jgi:hypothetical protein